MVTSFVTRYYDDILTREVDWYILACGGVCSHDNHMAIVTRK